MKDLVEIINKISTIIEILIKEYLINFIVSIMITVTLYYFIPTDNKILLKLGNVIFYGTVFLTSYLLIYIITNIFEKVKSNRHYAKQQKKYNREMKIKIIQETRNFIDNLNWEDRKVINYFLENDNKPLIVGGFFHESSILKNYCHKIKFQVNEIMYANNPVTLKENYELKIGMMATKYKLQNELYKHLKKMKDRNINISNF